MTTSPLGSTRLRSFTGLTVAALVGSQATGCNRTPENPPPSCENRVCTEAEGDALHTIVDASDREGWVYFDLELGAAVEPPDPDDSESWDLGFRRMVVESNGGVNGTGGVEVCVLEDTAFEDVQVAPTCAWIVDGESRPDPRDPGGTAFNEDPWYDYDLVEHTLHAKVDRVYVVKTVESGFVKLAFLDYYNNDGIPAWPSFVWSTLAPF